MFSHLYQVSISLFMKNRKKYFFLVAFILFTLFAKAQTSYSDGCYVSSEGRAYIIINGTCRYGLLNCDPSISNNYIVITRTTTTACTTCGPTAKSGVLVDFNVFACPFDNNLIALILASACTGIFLIRRTRTV